MGIVCVNLASLIITLLKEARLYDIPFYNVDDLTEIIPIGGGGTSFDAIFDYLNSNCSDELPACIVIFTDGDAPYPPESAAMGIPVLWMINNLEITPPWGRITRVLPNAES